MSVVVVDANKLYKAWRKYMLEHSGAKHFGMINDKLMAEFPYSNLQITGRPTNAGTLGGDEATVDLTVQTDNYINDAKQVLALKRMDDACWEFFQMLGFRRMGDNPMSSVNNTTVTRITSRFTLRNFTGEYLTDIDELLAD